MTTVRKLTQYVPITREAFRSRFFDRFQDPAFDQVRAELEKVCAIARENGALGAKLTGGGGGGSIIAVRDGDTEVVVSAIRAAGFQALPVHLGADLNGA